MEYEEKPGLAERVVAMRRRRGINQRDAAAEIGICRKYLGWFENGWMPHEGILGKIRQWLEPQEAAVAAAAAAAEDGGGEAAGEESEPQRPPREPDLPPRVPPQLRLAIRRLARRS